MLAKQQNSKTRKIFKPLQLCAFLTAPLVFMFSSSAMAEGRQASITESGNQSIHYYSSPIVASAPLASKIRQNAATLQTTSHSYSYWMSHASIGLNTDHDQDGHYSNFTLTFDVDTSLVASAVYAILYLSLEGGQWTEFAVSSNFTIRGSGPYDAYTIEADLESGYPSGYYDQYIEIYDAHSHELLLGHGPGDSHALYGLPIESSYHDNRFTLSSNVTLSFSGTGSFGLPLLLPLLTAWEIRRRRKQLTEKNLTNKIV